MYVRTYARRGFTLTEVMFTLVLLVILAGMSLSALRPAKAKGPTRGLAMALEEELSAARQLAISSGHPVALGMPTGNGARPVAASIYRLEGWNYPNLTWVKGFSGDYPGIGFVAGDWPGAASATAPVNSASKLAGFTLATWLPSDYANDYVFCFTPDGGLVGQNLKSVNGRYPVVVGSRLQASLGSVNAGNEPMTLMVSPYGGIEIVTGVPSGTLPTSSGGTAPISQPAQTTAFDDSGGVYISEIKVTPRVGGPGTEGQCVPGQYVTLEVYAYDPEGRGLFAKWKQPNLKGIFTYPDGGAGDGAVLESEVERMEFVNVAPPGIDWVTADGNSFTPPGGVFRARWGWTVPFNSEPEDRYSIEVDVKDASGQCEILNPPQPVVFEVSPRGKLIVEKLVGGIWQLVQMNPDGSNFRLLSPPGISETLASLNSTGTKMAFLRHTGGGTRVMIRPLDGGTPSFVDDGAAGAFTSVSLSPNGDWVSYRNNSSGQLITKKVNGTMRFEQTQSLLGTPYPRSRTGWSRDSKFMFFEHAKGIHWRNLESTSTGVLVENISSSIVEELYAPVGYFAHGQERVLFSLGNYNPVLMSVPVNRTGGSIDSVSASGFGDFTSTPSSNSQNMFVDLDGGGGSAGSGSFDDCYPNISSDNQWLILNRTPIGTDVDLATQATLFVGLNTVGNYEGGSTGTSRLITGDFRRAIWVP